MNVDSNNDELSQYADTIRSKPFTYLFYSFGVGLSIASTFWLWFYSNKIDDIQRYNDSQIKNLEYRLSINEKVIEKTDYSDEIKLDDKKGYIIIDQNSEAGKVIYKSIKEKNEKN